MNIPLTVLLLDCETTEADGDKTSTLSLLANSTAPPGTPCMSDSCDDLEEIRPTIQRLFEDTIFMTSENVTDSNSCGTTRSERRVTLTCSDNSANLAVASNLSENRGHTPSQCCWSGEVISDIVSDLLVSAGSSEQLPGHGHPAISTYSQYEEQKGVHRAAAPVHTTTNDDQVNGITVDHKAIARMKNRQAAQRFRDRKKEEFKDLEKRVKLLWRTRRLWQVVYSVLRRH